MERGLYMDNIVKSNEEYENSQLYQTLCNNEKAAFNSLLGTREERTFTYCGHISDSQEFRDYITDFATTQHGKTMLMDPCMGAGKTYYTISMLINDLKKRDPKAIAVELSPLTSTVDQSAMYTYDALDANGNVVKKHPVKVSGNSNGQFYPDPDESVFVSIYDKAAQIEDLGREALSHVCLIVDEYHQLPQIKSYRYSALAAVMHAIEIVKAAGGTVICMTGTPDKILCDDIDTIVHCVRVDKAGNPVSPICVQNIEIVCKDATHGSMLLSALALAYKLRNSGYFPLMMINDKEAIDQMAESLKNHAFVVGIITAQQKGFKIRYVSEDGTVEKVYNSKFYEGLITDGVLPYADVYLTTSLIEVGTSITGIRGADGQVFQPDTLAPVFVVLRANNFELHSLQQFICRPRFPVETAYILVNAKNKSERARVERSKIIEYAARSYAKAQIRMMDLNNSEDGRGDVIGFDGKCEDAGLIHDGDDYHVDKKGAWADGYDAYSRALVTAPYALAACLTDMYHVNTCVTDIKAVSDDEIQDLDLKYFGLEAAFDKYVKDQKQMDALMDAVSDMDICYSNPAVQDFLAEIGGEDFLKKLVLAKAILPAPVSTKGVFDVALAWVENPDLPYNLPGVTVDDEDAPLRCEMYGALVSRIDSELTDKGFEQLMDYVCALRHDRAEFGHTVDDLPFHPNQNQLTFARALVTHPHIDKICRLWTTQHKNPVTALSKHAFCELIKNATARDLKIHSMKQLYLVLNSMDHNSKTYRKALMKRSSSQGLVYEILYTGNYGQGFLYADQVRNGKQEAPYAHFKDGFQGKVVKFWDRKMLALIVMRAIEKSFAACSSKLTPADIGNALKAIYTYSYYEEGGRSKNGTKYEIVCRDYRKSIDMHTTRKMVYTIQASIEEKEDRKKDEELKKKNVQDMPEAIKALDDTLRKEPVSDNYDIKMAAIQKVNTIMARGIDIAKEMGRLYSPIAQREAQEFINNTVMQLQRTVTVDNTDYVHYRRGLLMEYLTIYNTCLSFGNFGKTTCPTIERLRYNTHNPVEDPFDDVTRAVMEAMQGFETQIA